MKDSEFIELLNLYLDHEITAADAARLEAEVQSNPKRRHVYQEYCRMQKGCKLLAADFQTEAVPTAAHDRKVIDFATASRPVRSSGFYTMGALAAAAACVAIVLIGRNRESAAPEGANPSTVAVVSTPSQVQAPVATQAVAATTPRTTSEAKVATASTRGAALAGQLSLADDAQMAAVTAQANAQFAWIHGFQLAPLPQALPAQQDLQFDARPANLRTEPRMNGQRAPTDAAVEMTAVRFQR